MKVLIEKTYQLFLNGQLGEAYEMLSQIRVSELDRKHLAEVAELARKIGNTDLAIRLLNPIVRPKNGLKKEASVFEKAVYAGTLVKIGAVDEGMEILSRLSPSECPSVLLYIAHGHMAEWNYLKAVPYLKKYLSISSLTEIEIIVGKINLAACTLEDPGIETFSLLESIRKTCRGKKWTLFLGISLELSAQLAIDKKDWLSASEFLKEATTLLAEDRSLYAFLVLKWKTIFEMESIPTADWRGKLNALREKALQLKHWESVRDCDFLFAIRNGDTQLFQHLYYGTPYLSFRKRLFRKAKNLIEISPTYILTDGSPLLEKANIIDLSATLKPYTMGYRLLKTLTSDFYKAFRVGVLFSQLYKDEYFNPDSSPSRVRQAVQSLKQDIKKKSLPFSITDSADGYRFQVHQGSGLLIPKSFLNLTLSNSRLEPLRSTTNDQFFTVNEVTSKLGVSLSHANRILKEEIKDGRIFKSGFGKATRYSFTKEEAV